MWPAYTGGLLILSVKIASSGDYLQKATCERFAVEIHTQSKTCVNWMLFLFPERVKMASIL